MRGGEPGGRLLRVARRQLGRQRAPRRQEPVEARPGQQLHHHIRHVLVDPCVEDDDHVRMPQAGNNACLTVEPGQQIGLARWRGEQLDCHRPAQQAEDGLLGRAVAVKLFTAPPGQPDLLARFDREARIVAGLRHPNLVVVFDAGVDQDVPYVVMELLAGPSLDALLALRGPLPLEVALGYAKQAAAGLAAAHAAGVVHRDVKPGNLVLDGDGTLKVVDFGIASLAGASTSLTASGGTLGTPAYLSPEPAAGRPAEPRSDLYALGCVLYALLTGSPPFTGDHPVATAVQHLNAAAPPVHERRPDLPPVIDQLLATLLAKDPQDRPPDAATAAGWLGEVRRALPPAASAATIAFPVAGPEGSAPPRRPPGRRRGLLGIAGGAAVAVLLAALALTRVAGHPAQAGLPASSRPAATRAPSRPATTRP